MALHERDRRLRVGHGVEINALWYQVLRTMAGFARRLGQPVGPWEALAMWVRDGFDRFWNGTAGYCYDVIDGPAGHGHALRPNQILAVSLAESPLVPWPPTRSASCSGWISSPKTPVAMNHEATSPGL